MCQMLTHKHLIDIKLAISQYTHCLIDINSRDILCMLLTKELNMFELLVKTNKRIKSYKLIFVNEAII